MQTYQSEAVIDYEYLCFSKDANNKVIIPNRKHDTSSLQMFRTRIYCFPSEFIRSQSRKSGKLANLSQSRVPEDASSGEVALVHSFTEGGREEQRCTPREKT